MITSLSVVVMSNVLIKYGILVGEEDGTEVGIAVGIPEGVLDG